MYHLAAGRRSQALEGNKLLGYTHAEEAVVLLQFFDNDHFLKMKLSSMNLKIFVSRNSFCFPNSFFFFKDLTFLEYFQVHSKIKKVPGSPGDPVVRSQPCNSGDTALIPGLGRSHMLCGY